ncbi:protein tyrosine/serine phosphatase [Branchiibius hedensis]|uniref:Protein tyrosine/serine phosphatase n=1 Tax=Branchiibius hedensis TaxID=672460 RepID=A0A2Y8ZPC9_9MICO|nr:tyrosine-protein phosphatase [Branchiibius hedensis]PWJ24969.1 protein tyrosine/serine phosphatase [Branchiibius hedensis]SSA33785.1 Protein tyrosine/serine phosphatase [Branchiibius hedensis]
MTRRWIDLDGLVNMRDVGGLPTANGGRTQFGRLIRSDNLQDLTAQDVRRLVDDLGVTDIVDLRADRELHLEGPGPMREVSTVTHHHHSLLREKGDESTEDVAQRALGTTPRRVRDADFWARNYLGYLEHRPDSVSGALSAIADASGATVVHCAAGKDRTGTVVAMALDVAGVPHTEIAADYALTQERLAAIVARLSQRPSYGEALATQTLADQTPHADSALAILTALADGWGGAAGWLRDQGWSQDEVDRLRDRLTR